MRATVAETPSRDPRLSRFDPLERILYLDDFDAGTQGWTAHIGNYEGSLDTLRPQYADLRPAMLSNLTTWDVGSAGSMQGTYALKLATRPTPGHMAILIKRQTWRALEDLRIESYLAYKPEASELSLGDTDVRALGIGLDLQDEAVRWMPQYRLQIADQGRPAAGSRTQQDSRSGPRGKWQHRRDTSDFAKIGESGATVSHWHLADEGWQDVPGGEQALCYNEIPSKVNWVYVRLDLSLKERRVTRLQCNDLVIDDSPLAYIEVPAMPNLHGMLNLFFWVQTDVAKRSFLYLDSVLVSSGGRS